MSFKLNGRKPLFLLTNDDGYNSPGITTLATTLQSIGDVYIVAPRSEKSASSHSVTFFDTVRVKEVQSESKIPTYSVDGTPVDCVKLGVRSLLKREPDCVVSGINNGENTGQDIHYSGTVSAAVEGVLYGIPSVAVSVPYSNNPRFDTAGLIAQKVITNLLINNLYEGVVLNLNVPNLSPEEIEGVRVTRQSDVIREDFYEVVKDEDEEMEFQIYRHKDGYFPEGLDVDRDAILKNFASLTPLHFNNTHEDTLTLLRGWNIDL